MTELVRYQCVQCRNTFEAPVLPRKSAVKRSGIEGRYSQFTAQNAVVLRFASCETDNRSCNRL
jgi:hypothetical protein